VKRFGNTPWIWAGTALLTFWMAAVQPYRAALAVTDRKLLEETSSAFSEIARSATPAVVFIEVEKTIQTGGRGQVPQFFQNDPFEFFGDDFLRRFFQMPQQRSPRQFRQRGAGSGFLISEDGYILSNSHVVGDADRITVTLHDGRTFKGRKVGADPHTEVAVIKIEGSGFPFLRMGDSSTLEVGEWVIAIGNPFGLTETVTVGIVSAKGRANIGIADYEDFIQTDAAINPGNSGGPLLNIAGEVVGINTAIYSRSGGYMGIGFAIPIDMASAIKDQLVETGTVTRSFLGVVIQDVDEDLAGSFGLETARGILIAEVQQNSAAEKGGLKQGDIILKLDGREVEGVNPFRNTVASTPPGTALTLTVFRDHEFLEVRVITESLDDEGVASGSPSDVQQKLGLTVQDLDPALAQRFGYQMGEGVIVSQVEPGSIAADEGIRPGALIVEVNRQPVSSAAQFRDLLAEASGRGNVLLLVRDGQSYRFVILKLGDEEEGLR